MVRKKNPSKRLTAAKRYKIEKRVREHNRKARKELKNHPNSNRSKKDPGVPNLFPFKDKVLKEAGELKKRLLDDKEKQKLLRQKLQKKNKNLSTEQTSLLALATSANQRSNEYEKKKEEVGEEDHIKDHSKKAFYKEFKKVVEAADVILEVLDARDPMGCRSKQVEELILNTGADKKIILVLNKIDLVPREVVEKWMKFLRNEFPTIAFKASTQIQGKNLGQLSASVSSETALNSSECLGADSLMKLLKNYCRNANIKTSISVGVIGFPNVGKSSLINSLKRSKACRVGSTPGVTRVTQEIHLDKQIKLIDCPGIVFASGKSQKDVLLLRNCLKVEQLEDPIDAVTTLLKRCNKVQIREIYSVNSFETTSEFLVHLARQRGKLKRSGILDQEAAAKIVLKDWNSGKIPYYVQPPKDERLLNSSIVSKFASEFSVDEIEGEQNLMLNSILDSTKFTSKVVSLDHNDAQISLEDEKMLDKEDGDEDMEEDEEEEEEEIPELVPIPAFETTKKQKKANPVQAVPKPQIIDVAESQLNLQVNQQMKLAQKKLKKLNKKQGKKSNETHEDEEN